MNIESVFDRAVKNGIGSLANEEQTAYLVQNAFVWCCMEGLAGYLTGYNRDEFPLFIDALATIGADSLSKEFLELLLSVRQHGGLGSEEVERLMFREKGTPDSDLGLMVDRLCDQFTDYADDWQEKLDAFCQRH